MMNRQNPFITIAIIAPFMLWGMCMVMPVFDDWWHLTTPGRGMDFTGETLLPLNQYWRPLDALSGLVLAKWLGMFQILNHLCVFIAHLGCTILVWSIIKSIGLSQKAIWTGTMFFFISPAILGTLPNTDSLNQAYSAFFGLLSLHEYMTLKGNRRYIYFTALVLIASLWKDNGLAWAAVTPIFAYGAMNEERKLFIRGMVCCILICTLYFGTRLSLQIGDMANPEFFEQQKDSHMKYIGTWLAYSLMPIDYISLMFKPERNWWFVGITAALGTPFLAILGIGARKSITDRRNLTIIICAVLAALPRIVTVFSNMHCYASLGMVPIGTSYLTHHNNPQRLLTATFCRYLAACLFCDYRHWQATYKSGLTGQRMAASIVRQSHKPVRRVLLLYGGNNCERFSTLCTPPIEPFGYGEAVRMAINYKWPYDITDVASEDKDNINITALKALVSGYDAVWTAWGSA